MSDKPQASSGRPRGAPGYVTIISAPDGEARIHLSPAVAKAHGYSEGQRLLQADEVGRVVAAQGVYERTHQLEALSHDAMVYGTATCRNRLASIGAPRPLVCEVCGKGGECRFGYPGVPT